MTNRIDDIWMKIDVSEDLDKCWEWLGYRSSGYGRVDILGRKGVYAHRVAYLATHPGEVTLDSRDGIFILHRCDNRVCCNPRHLYIGDHKQNMKDKAVRGRCADFRGTRSAMSKLTEEDVRMIRSMKKNGATVKALSLLHEVSMATISGCLYGRHYQDVD
jgi:hypothetical protein